MFDVRHHWLIIFSRSNFSNIFGKVEMYINADIHASYPKDLRVKNKNYTIEDVYNPASGKGGKMKRKVIGFYNELEGYKVHIPNCKYCDRRDMTNVALKTKIVVSTIFII